jgi:hypothetical protein
MKMKFGIEITRAVEDQSTPILEEITSKLGGVMITSLDGCSRKLLVPYIRGGGQISQ